ncbi:hypothetical protein IDH10_04155 [Pelagibacterales bacterium SAG-MED20]|nr:hypothetical protein [Pelagibacterales bacterium SAG-MED20]
MKNFLKSFLKKILTNTGPKPLENNKIKIHTGLTKNKILKGKTNINLYNFGKLNKNKIFYIIRRSPGAGLFSNVIYVINHLIIAKENGFKPFVDMQNYKTIYNEKYKINKTLNAWEYYFEQVSKDKIKDIYKSRKVIITDNTFYKKFKHSITKNKLNKITKKYLKTKKEFVLYANNFVKKNFKDKTLGIHYRGTSYKTSANHPFPPTKKQIIDRSRYLMKKYKYNKIFLCTEEKEIFHALCKEFGNKICFIRESYRSDKDDAFKKYPRRNHRYKLGKEILIESLILSKCQGFLYQNSNVSEFVKYLDNKNKIKYFFMKTAFNSSNEYIAKWLWYYKNQVPKFLGGFE